MIRIDRETTINAPLQVVFSYIANLSNWPEFWTSLIKIRDVETLPNGGYSAKYQYKMAGRLFNGSGEYTEFVPNQCIVVHTKGGIKSTLTWTFRSKEDKTRVTLTIEYKIPIPLLGFLAEPIISEMNNQDADLLMKNLGFRFMFWNSIHR